MLKRLVTMVAALSFLSLQLLSSIAQVANTPPTHMSHWIGAMPANGYTFHHNFSGVQNTNLSTGQYHHHDQGNISNANQSFSGSTNQHSINLDLSSTSQTMTAGHLLYNGNATINVGGNTFIVNSATLLTPTKKVALTEIVKTGQQTISANTIVVGQQGLITSALS